MSLNTETLNTILAPYIRSLTDGKTAENGVWEAINCFGTNWDIDAVDFPAMFAQATQQARAVMDTPALQPIGGMQALMMRPTEVELVRECFRWLFNDDDGDLKKRQGRVEMFADQVNGRFRRCLPRMAKFTQTAGSAALYLSLLEPEDNYFFVPAEAKAWAAYFGYDEDFGTGAAFNLTQYYAMCDDLLNELPKYDELTRLHTERLKNTMHGINDQLHLLVYDIMHSAYVNGYYPKGFSRTATAKERSKAVKQKAERADLCMQIAEKEQKLQELLASPTALPDLTGCEVTHKMFGVGKVLPSTDQFLVIDFNGQQKKFSTTTSMTSGYLTASDPAVMEQMQDYQAYTKEKDQLEKELKTMKSIAQYGLNSAFFICRSLICVYILRVVDMSAWPKIFCVSSSPMHQYLKMRLRTLFTSRIVLPALPCAACFWFHSTIIAGVISAIAYPPKNSRILTYAP